MPVPLPQTCITIPRIPTIIHQDIKPANVMVGFACVLYLKSALQLLYRWYQEQMTYTFMTWVWQHYRKHLETVATLRGDGAGTLSYKAPEMFIAAKRSTPADIYSSDWIVHQKKLGRAWVQLKSWQQCVDHTPKCRILWMCQKRTTRCVSSVHSSHLTPDQTHFIY